MIRLSTKTKARETLRVYNIFSSYVFEQAYGELSKCTKEQKDILIKAIEVLNDVIKDSKS